MNTQEVADRAIADRAYADSLFREMNAAGARSPEWSENISRFASSPEDLARLQMASDGVRLGRNAITEPITESFKCPTEIHAAANGPVGPPAAITDPAPTSAPTAAAIAIDNPAGTVSLTRSGVTVNPLAAITHGGGPAFTESVPIAITVDPTAAITVEGISRGESLAGITVDVITAGAPLPAITNTAPAITTPPRMAITEI